jgi:hypothetical protein
MNRPRSVPQAVKEIFIGAIVTRGKHKFRLWVGSEDAFECLASVCLDGPYLYNLLPAESP